MHENHYTEPTSVLENVSCLKKDLMNTFLNKGSLLIKLSLQKQFLKMLNGQGSYPRDV